MCDRVNMVFSLPMRTIGKYEVVEKIGEGGFGTIYKGFDPHIRRFVAIKACSSEEQEVRNRFFHEAQIAGNLQHRHIVTVYDFGLHQEVPYLVQEYLSGEDLDRKIKRKDLIALPEKLLYLMQVARGLEYAHSKGVIHRDIKPANVRILEDGTAKIMDFGIAKLANQDSGLTQTGMTLGTAAYLAPEQIRGEIVGPATDLFSWGVTAWELIAYERPFGGQHISTVLYQILHERPRPLRGLAPEVPEQIVAVIERCLEKKPERRHANCTELLRDLEEAVHGPWLGSSHSGLAADAQSETAVTRPFTPPKPPSRDARTAPVPTPPRHGELGDFDLEGTGDHRRTPHSISATSALRSRGFQWGSWAAGAGGVLVLALVAWWMVSHARASRREAAANRAESSPASGMALAASAGANGVGVPLATPTPAATPTPTVAATPEPTPTPTARPALLVVPAAWSPQVSVTVGKQRRSLYREQRFVVSPDSSTRVVFAYDGEYRDQDVVMVRIQEGETKRLKVPLLRPGVLQVQPKVNTPLGRVVLDSTPLGSSIVRRAVKPGPHVLRVEPLGAMEAAAIEQSVLVPEGGKLVLTYDLASGRVQTKVGDLPTP